LTRFKLSVNIFNFQFLVFFLLISIQFYSLGQKAWKLNTRLLIYRYNDILKTHTFIQYLFLILTFFNDKMHFKFHVPKQVIIWSISIYKNHIFDKKFIIYKYLNFEARVVYSRSLDQHYLHSFPLSLHTDNLNFKYLSIFIHRSNTKNIVLWK